MISEDMPFNLERDLVNSDMIRSRVQTDRTFAEELYGALCNTQFLHTTMTHPDEEYWSCSWRYAGELVSHLEAAGGDYMDYYCWGNEGEITLRIAEALMTLGWWGRPWPKRAD